MSCIVKCKSGKHVYLYESESFRDDKGRPRNKRKCIGRIDPESGETIYNAEYLKRVQEVENHVDADDKPLFSVNDIKGSVNKEFGAFYLLEHIAEAIGLTTALKSTMPGLWDQILAFACYMLASGEPSAYCDDWLAKTESFDVGSMSSQRVSELLLSITDTDRIAFYEKWGETRSEHEYFALDITSVSSYSELIGDVAWGYNRDGENLPQINLCMLVGEKSRLPIFQTVYCGALKDVSTLKTTLAMTTNIGLKNIAVIMDKGFASRKNIDTMLSDEDGIRFLVSLPFTMKFAVSQVESERKDIDTVENTIQIGSDIFRGVTKTRSWDSGHKIQTHIFYNAALAFGKRNELYGYVAKLRTLALAEPNNSKHSKEFRKYLRVRKSARSISGVTVSVRQDVIEKELSRTGWMVAVSNFIADPKEAISVYRAKDVVEKGFLRLKHSLDIARLRVHGDITMQNKIFIGFIALILIAHIHKVMDEKELYGKMTMKKMIKSLETLRVQYIHGERILYPPTAVHKEIFSAFGFALPT